MHFVLDRDEIHCYDVDSKDEIYDNAMDRTVTLRS
jgi:hypothetical protein